MMQLAHVVNAILLRAHKDNIPISPMKLQKLVYLLYGAYLLETGEPLFAERFEVWQYGPVVGDIYHAFKKYRDKPVREFMVDANGKYKTVDLVAKPTFTMQFNRIWDKFSGKTGIELSNMTHYRGGAWYKALSSRSPFIRDDDIREEMKVLLNAG